MSPSSKSNNDRTQRGDRLIEVFAVVLLAIATLGSAWCGYQASRWNGEEAEFARQATDARVEASRQFGLATQKVAYDSTIVAQYAQAYIDGNERLMSFYRATLIRPDFLPIIDRWQEQIVNGGETPTNLFQDEEYIASQFSEYTEAEAKANELNIDSQVAGEVSDDYVLTTLLLASALFFAGVTTSFRIRIPRLFLLACAAFTIAYATSRVVTLDVT